MVKLHDISPRIQKPESLIQTKGEHEICRMLCYIRSREFWSLLGFSEFKYIKGSSRGMKTQVFLGPRIYHPWLLSKKAWGLRKSPKVEGSKGSLLRKVMVHYFIQVHIILKERLRALPTCLRIVIVKICKKHALQC